MIHRKRGQRIMRAACIAALFFTHQPKETSCAWINGGGNHPRKFHWRNGPVHTTSFYPELLAGRQSPLLLPALDRRRLETAS